uniref:Uncharacterized protein n=1 Tax=Romanomermis culicivorax TaxID=13658 RepID=A0A915KDT0_ROMCU
MIDHDLFAIWLAQDVEHFFSLLQPTLSSTVDKDQRYLETRISGNSQGTVGVNTS